MNWIMDRYIAREGSVTLGLYLLWVEQAIYGLREVLKILGIGI